jgi:hypothetical protein
MKVSQKLVITSALIMANITYNAIAATDQTLSFKNQRGSTMTLTFHTVKNHIGTISGTFTTAVGSCKADVGAPMPVTGFFNNNAVSIAIDFVDCESVATMAGNLVDHQTALDTLWLVTSVTKDPMHKNWNSNLIGSDYFKKIG